MPLYVAHDFWQLFLMTHSVQLSCRSAKVSRDTAYEHRKGDAEFAKQWDEAAEHAIDADC